MINPLMPSTAPANQLDPEKDPHLNALHHRGRSLAAIIKRLFRIRLALFGTIVIGLVILMAVLANWIAPYDPESIDVLHMLEGPGWLHPLGTDQLGRDTLSRIIFGSRIALVSFPSLILAVGLIAVLGSTLINVIISIGLANVPWIARVVRSQVLSVREQDYVTSARAIGSGYPRIIFKYIWPNSAAPVIVQSTLGMAYAVLTEAALGFIGIGVQPPTPTWGNMLRYAFSLLDRSPILSLAPGLAIFLLILAFNFIGDALRDVLDPRLKGVIS